MWAIGRIPVLDFSNYCTSELAGLFPKVKNSETSGKFRALTKLRSATEIAAALDIAYCAHWAIENSKLRAQAPPGAVDPYVIVERRRALQWITTKEEWDEVVLDT